MTWNPLVVIVVILSNWQEASVYFWLAVISGLLIFGSCVVGACLSQPPAPPPSLTPYLSRAPSRAHSMHALSYITTPGSLAPTLKMNSPTFSSYSRHTLMDCSKYREAKGWSEESDETYPWIFVENSGYRPKTLPPRRLWILWSDRENRGLTQKTGCPFFVTFCLFH